MFFQGLLLGEVLKCLCFGHHKADILGELIITTPGTTGHSQRARMYNNVMKNCCFHSQARAFLHHTPCPFVQLWTCGLCLANEAVWSFESPSMLLVLITWLLQQEPLPAPLKYLLFHKDQKDQCNRVSKQGDAKSFHGENSAGN